jgi:cyanophycinase
MPLRYILGAMKLRNFLVLVLLLSIGSSVAGAASSKYKRVGSDLNAETHIEPGIALMGGGAELKDAVRWPDRKAAQEVRVARIIRQATVIFIAGGDQANYLRFWKGTPVQEALNAHVLAGKPIAGTSAGLAVLGQFVYGSLEDKPNDDDLASRQVLDNPYSNRVTLERDFLKVPGLENILTDSHFATRDRMGRSLGFLARIVADGWSKTPREIAIDEKSALLMEVDGRSKVVGTGSGVYFLQVTDPPEVCKPGQPLTLRNVAAYHAPTGATFDVRSWTGEGGEAYSISVEAGQIHTSRPGNAVY